MTIAQKIRLQGFNASLAQRGVSVTVLPGGHNLFCLVQPVDDKAREQLQIADDSVSHIVHIGRSDLLAAGIAPKSVVEIERADTTQTYRVQHFRDDAQRPAVLFFSILA
jgi:hypothetical protein